MGQGPQGPEGERQGKPLEDSKDKGSSTTEWKRKSQETREDGSEQTIKRLVLNAFLSVTFVFTHTQIQVQSDKLSRCYLSVNGQKGKKEISGREHLTKKTRQISNVCEFVVEI